MTSQTARPEPNPSNWRTFAACRGTNPDLYFPPADSGPARDRQVAAAKAVCTGCMVVRLCLAEALVRIPEGIAGGLTAEERRVARPAEADVEELARVASKRTETAAAGVALLAAGRSRTAVARLCGVSERTVYRWRARFETTAIRGGAA